MKPRDDMLMALAASVLAHAFIFMCSARSSGNAPPMPVIREGESAVTLTFVSIPRHPKPRAEPERQAEPEPVPDIYKDVGPEEPDIIVVEPGQTPEQPEKHHDEPEPERQESHDADLLTKGAAGIARPESEIRPRYPLGSRMRGEEGSVTVDVRIVPPGSAREIEIAVSSGYPALDKAAVSAVERARFVTDGGEAVRDECRVSLVFRFQLVD